MQSALFSKSLSDTIISEQIEVDANTLATTPIISGFLIARSFFQSSSHVLVHLYPQSLEEPSICTMADPLSAAAGIIGVLTAAVHISKLLIDFTKRTKDAPRQASQVLSEVNDVHTIMAQLQAFLLGLDTPDQSQACHVQVESLLSVLTGCVATFSDLEQLLDQMRSDDLTMLDCLKWAKRDSSIEALISRLQIHKNSLTLILEIVNGCVINHTK